VQILPEKGGVCTVCTRQQRQEKKGGSELKTKTREKWGAMLLVPDSRDKRGGLVL